MSGSGRMTGVDWRVGDGKSSAWSKKSLSSSRSENTCGDRAMQYDILTYSKLNGIYSNLSGLYSNSVSSMVNAFRCNRPSSGH